MGFWGFVSDAFKYAGEVSDNARDEAIENGDPYEVMQMIHYSSGIKMAGYVEGLKAILADYGFRDLKKIYAKAYSDNNEGALCAVEEAVKKFGREVKEDGEWISPSKLK